jgi:xylan 1,4-beta-xylosidase
MKLFRSAILLSSACLLAQDTATIRVDASASLGPRKPVWAFFGYDEPNYTYMKDGRKLLTELQALSPVPVYVRAHSLLTSGDAKPSLKWGSTNAYTEDANGIPKYDWTVVDRIFDTYIERKMKPLVEIGFMPEALSIKPEPYKHNWDPSQPTRSIVAGWAYPPKDYDKWSALIETWVKHCVEKYGKAEVESWWWEVWNEPNISYWQSTPAEYHKLYDYSVAAAKKALPSIRIGGPTSTGPGSDQAAKFLREFLEHVIRGKNYKTGQTGTPLDYISFHAKGRPSVVDGHVRMGSEFQMRDVNRGFEIVESFPELRHTPIIIGESDPEGCAACSVRYNPQNNYRNGTMYPSYTAATFARKYELASRHRVNFEGAVTWAFEFEDQPWFEGFRDLATNGVDKPILAVFRMFGMMGREGIAVQSDHAISTDEMLKSGVKGAADINAFAARAPRSLDIMVWNYHDDDITVPDAKVSVPVSGLPSGVQRVLVHHYRVDRDHSNSYAAWKSMGSPQQPSPAQYAQLERAGQLELLESPKWISVVDGKTQVDFSLPRQGVSLIQFGW